MQCWWERSYHTGTSSRWGCKVDVCWGNERCLVVALSCQLHLLFCLKILLCPLLSPLGMIVLHLMFQPWPNLVMKSLLGHPALLGSCLLSGCVSHLPKVNESCVLTQAVNHRVLQCQSHCSFSVKC